MASCAAHNVRKPPKGIMSLLAKAVPGGLRDPSVSAWDSAFPPDRIPKSSSSPIGGNDEMTSSPPVDPPLTTTVAAVLSRRTSIPMGDPKRGAHWGNIQLVVLLDVLAHCPCVEEIDWSTCRLYDADAYKLSISGNDLVALLSAFAIRHPRLQRIKPQRAWHTSCSLSQQMR